MIKEDYYKEKSGRASEDAQTSVRLNISKKKHLKKEENKFVLKHKIYILISLLSLIIIGGIIALIVYFVKRPRNKNNEEEYEKEIIEITSDQKENNNFMLKVNDLKRILIEEKYNENIKVEDIQTNNFIYKKTKIDAYVISENKIKINKLYNKIYTVSISIQSECINTNNETCVEK